MTAEKEGDPARLAELRAKIDAIDESMHCLLMQRASVIDELIAVKGTARNGAAFRPGREAAMMRRLAERHQGHLPLTAIEHLWREIISTFTALQAPFGVSVALCEEPIAAVEAARFYFGFSVPLDLLDSREAVVRRLEEGGDRLGLVPLGGAYGAEGTPWWERLESAGVMARLPYFRNGEREAALPALVLAPPLSDPVPFEVECFAVRADAIRDGGRDEIEILGEAVGHETRSFLLASRSGRDAVERATLGALDIKPVGGYAAPLTIGR